MLDLISIFIGTVISSLTGIIFVKYILKESVKANKFQVILVVIANSLIVEILHVLGFLTTKAVIAFILNLLLFKISFKIANNKAFLTTIMFYLLLIVGEIVFLALTTNLLKISGNSIYIRYGATLFGNLFVSIIALCVGYIIKNFLRLIINYKIKKTFLAYLGWTVFCILVLVIAVAMESKSTLITFITLGVAITILLTVFMSLKQSYKHHELTIKYDKLLEFMKKYELEIDKQRTLRHETRNQFIIIKSKIIDKDKESNIIEYINEIIEDNNQKINNSEYAKLGYLPSNGIKGLFYFKVSEATDCGVDIKININKKIEKSFLNKLNSNSFNQVGKVLGIFLDNAIEGAKQSADKQLGIEVYCQNDEVIFIITNTHNTINFVSTNRRSTKGINRGHGLILAQQIINLNPKLSNETNITENTYTQKLIIKK